MPESTEQVCVSLRYMAGTAIIVPHACGVVYENQIGGYACGSGELEGVLVPLSTGSNSAQNVSNTCPLALELYEYFYHGEKWSGHCYSGIDMETADYLDALFQKYKATKYLRVDRTLLKKCKEAWIHVTLHFPEGEQHVLSGLSSATAILTWPNSD